MGKTRSGSLTKPLNWKHPHVHGEDKHRNLSMLWKVETPPRAWGRRPSCICAYRLDRNTPTCMGKTGIWNDKCRSAGKHPHVHGEDFVNRRVITQHPETPPRAWGRHIVFAYEYAEYGNTPTCMGKTSFFRCNVTYRKKHPHVHGEDPF